MLQLTQWEKYYPDVGANRQAPKEKRFFLEVERGLSTRQREGFAKQLADLSEGDPATFTHRLTAALSMHLRWGSEPLTWEGGTVSTLEQYVHLIAIELKNLRYYQELLGLVGHANSFSTRDADFFERPSGTAPGTTEGLAARTV